MLNFCYLKIIHILHPRYHPKIIGHILKNKQKNKCVCIHEIMWLIIMKMKMKMKYRSHRYGINRPRYRRGHKYSKYKKCLTMMMLICIRQHLSNIWSSIPEKVKQHWGWVKKCVAYNKKACNALYDIVETSLLNKSMFPYLKLLLHVTLHLKNVELHKWDL